MPLYIFGMTPLSCSISSITPIVTGDHDHRNTELLATGILGSFRYQYWLLKAMQAWQNNPQHPAYPPCSADLPVAGGNHFSEELHKAGPVIWLFGATNWKKMFRLEIADAVRGEPQSCSARSYSKAPHQWQNVKLTFRNDRESLIFEENGTTLEHELRSLMAFVHQYGWLGAAPQNGLGWVTVQGEGLERITLREENPVFAAKDIELPASCVAKLLATLWDFYVPKLADAKIKLSEEERRLEKAGVASKDYWKDKKWKDQHSRKTRYDQSLHLLNQKNKEFPIGYEIRRWLRDQMFPPERYKNEQEEYFGDQKHAGFVHVTHPVVKDGGWSVRIRFAVRSDTVNGTTRLHPEHLPLAPQRWLDCCEKLLKPS